MSQEAEQERATKEKLVATTKAAQASLMEGVRRTGIFLPNVVPKGVRTFEYDRPADDTPSGLPEKVTGTRFSLFISTAEAVDRVTWMEMVVSHDGTFYHGPNLMTDEDTIRVIEDLNVVGMDEECMVALPTSTARAPVCVRCHGCAAVIANIAVPESRCKAADADAGVRVCRGCGFARYCSDECATTAWSLGHAAVCALIRDRIAAAAVQRKQQQH